MASIISSGLGSGIDVAALVSQLVEAERAPVQNRLDRQEARFQAEITAFGSIKGSLSALQSALSGIKSSATFQARTATSAKPEVFTASATPAAVPGSYSVEVERLASGHKLVSAGFADSDAVVGTGTLSFATAGASFSLGIDESNNTLAGIRDAINTASGNSSVRATILSDVDDGAGGKVSKLVLTGTGVGADNALTVTVSGDADGNDTDAAGLSSFSYVAGDGNPRHMSEQQAALDARIRVDGQLVERSANNVSDAIDGVTLALVEAAPGESFTLTVAADPDKAVSEVRGTVNAFNAVLETLRQVASFDAATGNAGTLFGDATARGMEFQLRRAMSDAVGTGNAAFSSAVGVGITTGEDGKLSIDTARLEAALEQDPDAVLALFAGADGLAARLEAIVEGYVSSTGVLQARTDGLESRIDALAERREALDRRLASVEQRMLDQFNAMDALVGQLNNTSDFLTRQLSALDGLFNRNNDR